MAEFRLGKVDKKGVTLRDRLEAESRMVGKLHPDLKVPDMPPLFAPLLRISGRLKETTYQAIKAFSEGTGRKLDQFDIVIIETIKDISAATRCGEDSAKILRLYGYGTN